MTPWAVLTLALAAAAAPAPAPAAADADSARLGRTGKGAVSVAEEPAGDAPIAVSGEVRLVTDYFWRGYELSRSAPAVQPWLQAGWKGIGVWVWGSAALDRSTELDEFAAGLSYQVTFQERWTLIAGYGFYLSPGTETEASANEDDPLAPSISGEVMLAGAATFDNAQVQLTYSRGHSDAEGNSVNLWGQLSIATPWDKLTLEPYAQLDYMDQYGPPDGVLERLTNIEAGLVYHLRWKPFALLLVGGFIFIPSPYIRASNADAGSSDAPLRSFGGISFAYEGG
jgi:hypothetical protein